MKIYKFNNLKNNISDYIFINNIYKLEIVLLEKKLRKIEILLIKFDNLFIYYYQ